MTKNNELDGFMINSNDNPRASIDELTDEIIQEGDAERIYNFAVDVPGAPIAQLAEAIIQTGDAEWIYKFAADIPSAPIAKLAEAIKKTNNAEWIYFFAKRFFEKSSIDQLTEAIIQTEDLEWIYFFAKDIPGAPIAQLAEAIIQTRDAGWIYFFTRDVPGAPIDKLADAIIQIGAAIWIYFFARDVPGAPIAQLAEAIKKTKNEEYILNFSLEVPNLDEGVREELIDYVILLVLTLDKTLSESANEEQRIVNDFHMNFFLDEDYSNRQKIATNLVDRLKDIGIKYGESSVINSERYDKILNDYCTEYQNVIASRSILNSSSNKTK